MRTGKANALLLCVVAAALALAACSEGGSSTNANTPPRNSVPFTVIANDSLQGWLEKAAQNFNQAGVKTTSGRQAYAQVNFSEAGQAISDMSGGATLPVMWIPDNEVWTSVLAAHGKTGYQANCQSVAQSPLVIAMWRPIAEALGWPGRKLGWLDVGSLAADPSSWDYYSGGKYGKTLRLGHTHPGLSGSGASTLLAIVQAARSITEAVTVDDIKEPIVQASVAAFEGTVAWFSPSTAKLGQTIQERGIDYLGAAVEYESTVATHGGGGDTGLVAVYPYEGTFMATHPACIDDGADAQAQEAARLFRDYLLKPDAQKLAVQNGLRPVTSGVPISAPLDAAHGVDPTQPKAIFGAPSVDTISAISALWQAARKNINLVMLLDVSGSMRGDKIDSVRTAAAQFVKQMGDNDYLTLMTFSDKLHVLIEHKKVSLVRGDAVKLVNGIQAGGNTSLYDAIGSAANLIDKSKSTQASNVMVLLTDGQDTSSSNYDFNQELIDTATANDTTVFTIAYGSDADQDVLSKLASQGRGNFYQGTTANIAGIYEEMSAAFGGSVGIGR
ncbi:MAG: VWA domain-containing protein [Chloroflexi bacterium]|nr:VWA domain-containing protein [Chloroflexota bacterium]